MCVCARARVCVCGVFVDDSASGGWLVPALFEVDVTLGNLSRI